jgi:putative oxygen-independent coproporphyrinogen III oxidase
VPSALPDGDEAPKDGALPESALEGLGQRPLGVYVHVPFCATRCGYCDFNTYTANELAEGSPKSWLAGVHKELELAATVLGTPPPANTVFIGGGTPSLLGGAVLAEILAAIKDTVGLSPDAEVTTESNPESTSPAFFEKIKEAGYNRVSLGMQSAAPTVLTTLNRTHTPGRPAKAAQEAKQAGINQVNLDLIYGAPGETQDDLARSLDAALEANVDHISAYALIVEPGTALSRQVRRGELAAPNDDTMADRYEQVDETLSKAGLHWYEVSNWATEPKTWCHHNLGYWHGADWWGIGPGAHSHVGGIRWWNVKHPARYAAMLGEGNSPAAARETLTPEDRHLERVMLELRLVDGLPAEILSPEAQKEAHTAAEEGLLDKDALAGVNGRFGRCVLTLKGRLLADAVVRRLT